MRELIVKIESEIQRLRWLTAFNNFETAVRRFGLAVEGKFRVDQLRVPAGNPDGGQWTLEGSEENNHSQDARARQVTSRLPRIPIRRPSTAQERNRIARDLSRWGPETIFGAISGGASWLKEKLAEYVTSFDSPKSLEELLRGASNPQPGYDIHHIVERNSVAEDGSEDRLINAPENLVRIRRWKHWDLNSWYQAKNKDYENMTPRDYLRGMTWVVRRQVGLDGLRTIGALKP